MPKGWSFSSRPEARCGLHMHSSFSTSVTSCGDLSTTKRATMTCENLSATTRKFVLGEAESAIKKHSPSEVNIEPMEACLSQSCLN